MKKTCRNRITTWGLMGLLVVGLNVWFALPARAVPIDYILAGGQAVGGFTLDDTLVNNPYTAWTISFEGTTWNNLSDVLSQQGITSDMFELLSLTSDEHQLDFLIFFGPCSGCLGFPGYILIDTFLHDLKSESGLILQSSTSIPEPPPGVLLLIGLLVLAGTRLWTHRQERLPLG